MPHEPQKPAVFAATAIPPQIRQAIAKATKAKAGSNTSLASPVISAVMVRGFVSHARQPCAMVEETGHAFRSVRPWSHNFGRSDIKSHCEVNPNGWRVLSGNPERYGAEGARVFAIYENFPV